MPHKPAPDRVGSGLVRLYQPLHPADNAAERTAQLELLHRQIASCQRCVEAGFLSTADSVAGYRGRIGNWLMLVGQAPGHRSVEARMPFSGPSGRALTHWLLQAGFGQGALRTEVYLTAMTRCDPGRLYGSHGDRKPSPPEMALCRPNLERELELVRPSAILLAGTVAIEAFLGSSPLDSVVGTMFERSGVKLLPVPHPSGVSRWLNDSGHRALLQRALALLDDLRRARSDGV